MKEHKQTKLRKEEQRGILDTMGIQCPSIYRYKWLVVVKNCRNKQFGKWLQSWTLPAFDFDH